MNPSQPNTQQELINKCFLYWNSLKRHRALSEIKKAEGNREASNYHNLKTYQMGDNLELALRALQKGQRAVDADTGDDEE